MYETETEYTYDEYKKMQNIICIRRIYPTIIILFIAAIVVISSNNKYFYIGYAIMFVIAALLILMERAIRIKRGWRLNSTAEKSINKYVFLEDHFEEESNGDKQYIYYKDIYRIIETKTDLYIRTSIDRAFIIKKDKCSNELIQLIRKYK